MATVSGTAGATLWQLGSTARATLWQLGSTARATLWQLGGTAGATLWQLGSTAGATLWQLSGTAGPHCGKCQWHCNTEWPWIPVQTFLLVLLAGSNLTGFLLVFHV